MPLSLDGTGSITGIGTFNFSDEIVHVGDDNTKIRFPAADTITAETAGTERFRITSAGYLKVTNGSTSDFNTIQRASTSNYTGIRIQDADATQRMQIGVAGGTNNIATGSAQHDVVLKSYANLLLATNQTERLRIDSSGRAMIGTTTPSSLNAAQVLTIADTTASALNGNCGITIRSGTGGGSNTNEGSIFFSDATSGAGEYAGYVQYSHVNNWLRFGTASAPRVYIDSSGRMLIGTTTEGYGDADDLTIATAGNTGMTIRAGASNYGSIFFSDATSGTGEYDGFLQYGHTNQQLDIGTASVSKFRISSTGHVTTLGSNNGNAVGMELRNNNTADYSHAELALTSQNTTTSKIWCDVPNAKLRLQYNGGSTLDIDQSANVHVPNGSGIHFGASGNVSTMDSELLDDYEEGYWTPTVGGHTSNGSTNYGSQRGAYVKIGSLVFLNCYISWSSTTATGQFRIFGMPYAVQTTYGTNYNLTTGSMMFNSITSPYQNGQMVPYIAHSASQIVFYGSYYTSGWSILGHSAETQNSGDMIFSISYRAA